LAPYGITVNTVAPGFIPVERHADVSEAERAEYRASVPVGRMGTPDDIAHAVSFFASEGAGFVTGQRIVVDGGRDLLP
jgi:3-oxoacyl-[acyl-carrier protein] reductase